MTPKIDPRVAYLICFVVISIAIAGFFTGLQSPMNPSSLLRNRAGISANEASADEAREGEAPPEPPGASAPPLPAAIFATHYAQMHDVTTKRFALSRTSLTDLKSSFDPLAEVHITPEQKAFALAVREQNRAFNGAPPTIPHPVDQISSQACMVCHGEGVKTQTLRISRMPHQFLENCTQCHVENNPQQMSASLFEENTFVGLPAPTGGPKAYAGAPPMIPHTTWMRVDCMSCHGFAGRQGMRTTHPWRQNCQQCHAPSAALDQVQLNERFE